MQSSCMKLLLSLSSFDSPQAVIGTVYQEIDGNFKGIQINATAPVISHLLFADDCLLFSEATSQAAGTIRNLLDRYEKVSGQKINVEKSDFVCSTGISEQMKNDIRRKLGMNTAENHGCYLGLPIYFGRRKVSMFKELCEKIKAKCSDWKVRLLSAAGKEVLVKSVLQAIPVYAMSCFKIPKSVCKDLVTNVLNFWWDKKNEKRKIHWLRKDLILSEKENGGLGFKDFKHLNKALLAKQAWRILTEPDLLMSRIFRAKYFKNGEINSAVLGQKPSFAWRSIHSSLELIKHNMEWSETSREYKWLMEANGKFSVRSAYTVSAMIEKRHRNNQEGSSDSRAVSSFWRKFWKLNVPNKIKIFGWRLYYDGLPTALNLIRRGCTVNDSCMLCQTEKESSIHVFKECWYVKAVFAEMNLPDVIWINDCRDVGYWLWLCEGWCTKAEFETLLSGLWMCWFNRNQILHYKEPWSIIVVKQKLKHLIIECNRHLIKLFDGTTEELTSAKSPLVFCDGSWCGETKKAGLCAVLKHENMIMRVAACCLMNVQDANTAEGLAIKLGMELASGEQLEEAIIITDSAGTIVSISNGVSKSQGPYDWLPFCQSLWCNRPRWKLGLIPRDLNFEADSWARKARVQNWSWSDSCAVPTRVHL